MVSMENEQWYSQLIEDCKDIITEAVFTSRWTLVEGYHQLGERILEEHDNFERVQVYGEKIVQGLAISLGISARTIHYAIQFAIKYPSLDEVPEGKNISWNKIITKYLPKPRIEIAPTMGFRDITLIHGDMMAEVPKLGKFDLVIADSPYGVTDWEWDKIPEYKQQITQWLQVLKFALAEKYHFFWFCSPKWVADTEMVFRELNMPINSRIVWHRRNMSMGSDAQDRFIDSWEMIIHSGNTNLNWPDEWSSNRFDVQTFAVPQTNFADQKLHPTQKPLDLIKWLVSFGSKPSQKVLDPFAGAGTTGAACAGSRECTLIEKEGEYIDIIKARLGI